MFEIEYKYLVKWPIERIVQEFPPKRILIVEQRYLQNGGDWTIRIRKTVSDYVEHYLTMKKKISGPRCVELETPISDAYYATVSLHCGPPLMKTRYEIDYGDHTWEVDVFAHEKLDGLVLAEVEVANEGVAFDIPPWLGECVTHDKQYKNARLVKRIS